MGSLLEEFYDCGTEESRAKEREWLERWLVCLSSAMSYIHSQGLRHEDIKPSNIIHRGPVVYLTDFSSCTEFDDNFTTSTDTPAGRLTRIYSAPENLEDERHGLSADIFSLACVFAEILTVLHKGPLAGLYDQCSKRERYSNRKERLYYCQALSELDD